MITYNNFQAEPGTLAERETRYFLGFVQGLSAKQIARDCGVSPSTVDGARTRILQKLNAVRMTHAIALAFAQGMVRHLALALVVSLLIATQLTPVTFEQPMHRTPRSRFSRSAGTRLRSREDLTNVSYFA